MKTLMDVKVGDVVMVASFSSDQAHEEIVASVGSKYVSTSGRLKFKRESGQSDNYLCMTKDQWEHRQAMREMRAAIRDVEHASLAHVSTADIQAITTTLRNLVKK